ncbi:MAG: hybrid sensor histidine kinase/response regulator [Planctomycetota bacterium]|nr:hybrid sensor histidine kinase/response regulator [Planctomycetota bacterium]
MTEPKPKMLVVDDDARNRKLLQGYLESAGYHVRLTSDGPSALSAAHEDPPDVVLLDVMMSGMNGFEVCRELKGHPRTRLCQVALVTALDGATHTVEGLDHGADDYIAKPIRKDEFLAKVRSLLRVRNVLHELETAKTELAERNNELEALQTLKDMLAQALVHDLKNPLSAMVGNLQLLQMKVDPKSARHVQRCSDAASRLHRMILDLLDIAGMEEGALAIDPVDVDALELLSQAIDDVDASARQRSVELVLDEKPDPCLIHGDPGMLRRVMDNLITNAVEHSPADSCVRVHCREREEGIELSVRDEGPGVPEEQRERIFDKFARGNHKTPHGVNRGLGLTFCRLAVEAHGGAIWVERSPEGGSVFRALLPAADTAEDSTGTFA